VENFIHVEVQTKKWQQSTFEIAGVEEQAEQEQAEQGSICTVLCEWECQLCHTQTCFAMNIFSTVHKYWPISVFISE